MPFGAVFIFALWYSFLFNLVKFFILCASVRLLFYALRAILCTLVQFLFYARQRNFML